MANLAPVPSESSTCPNCSAPLVADQRYCLSCGQPTSPVRLAFLDVLESEHRPQLGPGAMTTAPVAYNPYVEPAAGPLWLRRYAPLFGVVSVLLLAMIAGLLVGHWVTQSKAPVSTSPQIIKIEGNLGGGVAATGSATTPTTATTPAATAKSSTSAKSEEEKERAEAKAEEKAEEKAPAKAPAAKALSNGAATKLEKSTGKAKEKELNKITTAPIEVK
jgi:predicted lipid-binding transport protein (Tim44 family)